MPVRFGEVVGMLEHAARQVGHLDAPDRGMQRDGMRRVSNAEADDERRARRLHRQQRQVRERAHVALRQRPRRRHRMAVGQQPASARGHVGDLDDLGEPFVEREPAFVPRQCGERPCDDRLVRQALPPHQREPGDGQRRAEGAHGRPVERRGRVEPCHDVQGHRRQGGNARERRETRLQTQDREQEESGREGARDGTRGIREIQGARAAADRTFRPLDDRIRQGEAEPHEQCRHPDFQNDGRGVEPQLGEHRRAAGGGVEARERGVDGGHIHERRTDQRRGGQQPLNDDEPSHGPRRPRPPPGAPLQQGRREGPGPDAHQDDRQQQ